MKPTGCSVGIDISSLSRLPNGVASLGIVNLLDVANLITGQREKDRPEIPDNIVCQLDSLIQNQYVQNVLGLKKAQAKNGSYWTTTVRDIPSDDRTKSMFSHEKYKFFLDAPFEISNMCCYVMKKSPAKEYEKRTGKWAFTAMMASESKLRTSAWLKDGCNGFDRKHPMSNPMAFWTEQDVLLYLRENHDRMLAPLKERNPELKHPWVSVYGEILTDDEESGQVSLFDGNALDAGLFDFDRPELHTTGENRTGCMFCGFGCHIRKNDGHFERMKVSHPKIYKYLFGGEWSYQVFSHDGSEIDLRHVDKEMLKRWVTKNQENRRFKIVWKTPPKGGLGYADVIDWINEHGNFNIKY